MSCPYCEETPTRDAQIWERCDYCGGQPIYIDVAEKLAEFGLPVVTRCPSGNGEQPRGEREDDDGG